MSTDSDPSFVPDDLQGDRLIVDNTQMSPTIGKIAGALAKAQGAFGHLAKASSAKIKTRGDGPDYAYTYATLADSIDAIREGLATNGIAVVQTPWHSQGIVTISTLLAHESGEWMSSTLEMYAGEGGKPQSVGSAITYARRYALQAMVGIAPDDDDGGEAQKSATERPRQYEQNRNTQYSGQQQQQHQTARRPNSQEVSNKLRKEGAQILRNILDQLERRDGVKPDWMVVAANASGVRPWPECPSDDDMRAKNKGLASMTLEQLLPVPYREEEPDPNTADSEDALTDARNRMFKAHIARFRRQPSGPTGEARLARASGLDSWPSSPTVSDYLAAAEGLDKLTNDELEGKS